MHRIIATLIALATLGSCYIDKEVVSADGRGTLTRREVMAPGFVRIRDKLDPTTPSHQFTECLNRVSMTHGAVMAYGVCDNYFSTTNTASEVQRGYAPQFWNNPYQTGLAGNAYLGQMYGGGNYYQQMGAYQVQQPMFAYPQGYATQPLPTFQPNMVQTQYDQSVAQQITLFRDGLRRQGRDLRELRQMVAEYIKNQNQKK